MKTAILVVAGFVALIVSGVVIIAVIGATLARNHQASRSMVLSRTPAEVYRVIRDFAGAPKWRTDITSVELMPQPDGRIHFREHGKQGTINFALSEDVPNQRMVTRILDTNLGYSGAWTYTLVLEGERTRLTITEDGEVSNVIFRFMSRYVLGRTATMDAYLESLAKYFGEQARPQ